MSSPRIGITLGDPGGIGPEVLLKALQRIRSGRYVLFGSSRVLQHHSRKLKIPFARSRVDLVDVDNISNPYFGSAPKLSGRASIDYLESAFEYLSANNIDAIVTGPIHKESWHQNGFNYPGQTEYCVEKSSSGEYCMLMTGRNFRIALLSTHVSLRNALKDVREEKIVRKIRLIHREFVRLGFLQPRIACAALNPHAGEGGVFGKEELQELKPAIERLKHEGIPVDGPIAPEVVFRVAAAQKKWDVILALYHDQAMIPLKLIDFDHSANVTLGLPFIRTSPDHGTAFDIAGKGIANPGSMIYAMKLAVDWTRRRSRSTFEF